MDKEEQLNKKELELQKRLENISNMEKEILEQKAKMLEEVMNDKSYVPMKAKELAMLLGIPKSQRDELTQVLDYLVSEGRIGISNIF